MNFQAGNFGFVSGFKEMKPYFINCKQSINYTEEYDYEI